MYVSHLEGPGVIEKSLGISIQDSGQKIKDFVTELPAVEYDPNMLKIGIIVEGAREMLRYEGLSYTLAVSDGCLCTEIYELDGRLYDTGAMMWELFGELAPDVPMQQRLNDGRLYLHCDTASKKDRRAIKRDEVFRGSFYCKSSLPFNHHALECLFKKGLAEQHMGRLLDVDTDRKSGLESLFKNIQVSARAVIGCKRELADREYAELMHIIDDADSKKELLARPFSREIDDHLRHYRQGI